MKKVSYLLYLILVPVIFLLSWSLLNLPSGDKRHDQKKEQPFTEQSEPDLKGNESFPFEKIKRNSIHRKRFLDMSVLPTNLKPISKSFFKKWLENTFVSGAEKRLHFQSPEIALYHFYDFAETADLFLFSILITNFDSGQHELVHFVCDRSTAKINSAEQIAAQGGAGGYSIQSKMEYSADRKTLVVTSEVSQPIDRHWETYTYKDQFTFLSEKTVKQRIK